MKIRLLSSSTNESDLLLEVQPLWPLVSVSFHLFKEACTSHTETDFMFSKSCCGIFTWKDYIWEITKEFLLLLCFHICFACIMRSNVGFVFLFSLIHLSTANLLRTIFADRRSTSAAMRFACNYMRKNF